MATEGRVRLRRHGRIGTIRYREGLWRAYDFDAELGAGEALLLIYAPSPADWPRNLPWAANRRQAVLQRVAEEIVRLESPGAGFVVHAGGVDILRPVPTGGIGHLPPAS